MSIQRSSYIWSVKYKIKSWKNKQNLKQKNKDKWRTKKEKRKYLSSRNFGGERASFGEVVIMKPRFVLIILRIYTDGIDWQSETGRSTATSAASQQIFYVFHLLIHSTQCSSCQDSCLFGEHKTHRWLHEQMTFF